MRQFYVRMWASVMLFFLFSFQSVNPPHYTEPQIEAFVREVYADKADALVLKSPSNRLTLLTDFLNRFEIVDRPDLKGKKFKYFSEIALLNKYNAKLSRDSNFHFALFNPLKYQFPFYSKSIQIFRIDGTDLLIVIQPTK